MFNVGDGVEVVADAPYGITTEGSKGIVLSVANSRVEIKFYHLGSGRYGRTGDRGATDTYDIDRMYLKLSKTISKEEIVIIKINQMSARFDKRRS